MATTIANTYFFATIIAATIANIFIEKRLRLRKRDI